MCVIIRMPANNVIPESELEKAWKRNKHGGGLMYRVCVLNKETGEKEVRVKYERGIMDYDTYKEKVYQVAGTREVILHMRITTSKVVNEVQCHPYQITDIERLSGYSLDPVVCMNGTIRGQKLLPGYNDTMSYIQEHYETFMMATQDIINLIQDATGCRWAEMTPSKTFLSSNFVEHEGRMYSNLKHLEKPKTNYFSNYTYGNYIKSGRTNKTTTKTTGGRRNNTTTKATGGKKTNTTTKATGGRRNKTTTKTTGGRRNNTTTKSKDGRKKQIKVELLR